MSRFALFCIAFGFLFVFAGCAEKTPAPGDAAAPPTPVEGAYTPAVPTVSDKKSGNGEFACPASDPLPAKKHFIAAVNALEVGDPSKARPELLLALCQEPDHRRAKSLLKQIDEPPEAFFGADHFPYTVQYADSLSKVAKKFLGDPFLFYALARYNKMSDPSDLKTGQTIKIPATKRSLRVKEELAAAKEPEPKPKPTKAPPPPPPPVVEKEPEPAPPPDVEPPSPDWQAEAKGHMGRGQVEQAMAVLVGVWKQNEADAEVREEVIGMYEGFAAQLTKRGRADEARDMLNHALALGPKSPATVGRLEELIEETETARIFQEAEEAHAYGQMEKAYEGFGKTLERDPEHGQAQEKLVQVRDQLIEDYSKRAVASFRRHELDETISWWDKVLALEPENEMATLRRAEAVDLKERFEEKFEKQ